jgi:hypothetical protein
MLREIFSTVFEAVLAVPGVRFVLGLVDSRIRPFWAAMLLAGTFYLISRAANYVSLQRARRVVLAEDLAGDTPESESAETTVVLRPSDPPIAAHPPRVMSPALLGALIAGISGVMLVAIIALKLSAPKEEVAAGILAPDVIQREQADTSFAFSAAGWRNDGGTCIATMRVTALGRPPRRLSLFVMNAAGAVIGRDEIDKPVLAVGAMVDFRFRRVDCDDVEEWQVQGAFPTP